jgi:hypothetical protein
MVPNESANRIGDWLIVITRYDYLGYTDTVLCQRYRANVYHCGEHVAEHGACSTEADALSAAAAVVARSL